MKPVSHCGDMSPDHRMSKCNPCDAARQRKRRALLKAGVPLLGPACALCHIRRGNSQGIKVYRYSLVRNARAPWTKRGWTNKQVASLPVCDRCLIEKGYANPRLARAA